MTVHKCIYESSECCSSMEESGAADVLSALPYTVTMLALPNCSGDGTPLVTPLHKKILGRSPLSKFSYNVISIIEFIAIVLTLFLHSFSYLFCNGMIT